MKRSNSVMYAVGLSKGLTIEELPLENRGSRWWDLFWYYYGLVEAEQYKVEKL